MTELIITEVKRIGKIPVHHLTVIGKNKLTSLRYALEKARNAYIDIISEPDIEEQRKKEAQHERSHSQKG